MTLKKCVSLLVFCILVTVIAFSQTSERDARKSYAMLPLAFEANRGQVDARARYLARGSGYSLFLTGEESVLRLGSRRGTVLRTSLVGAQPAGVAAEAPLPGRVNYLVDPDPKKWVTDVPTYERVRYAGVYRGIDLLYYGKQGRLEYDFVVAPGADAHQIRMRIEGADKIRVAKDESLVIESGGMKVRWAKPVAYQTSDVRLQTSAKQTVAAAYRVRGNEISFAVGSYDRARALVIDPALVYSTYIGGAQDADPFNPTPPGDAFNDAFGVAVDGNGNAYVAGTTSATDFPITAGAYDTTENGSHCSPHGGQCRSGFVTKFNASGSALIYSTYFGLGPTVTGMALDSNNRVYLTGFFGMGGVPVTATGFQTTTCNECGTNTSFLSVLNSSGNGLVYSTFFKGTDDFSTSIGALAVAVGTSGVAYVTGGVIGDTMPVTANAYQATTSGSSDGFLAKINPAKSGAASLEYATYFGGNGDERGYSVATSGGRAYIGGVTSGGTFPTTTPAFDRTPAGASDGFVAKLDTNQSGAASLIYSTLLGGAGAEEVRGLALQTSSGRAYVTGWTESTDFPTTAEATQKTHAACGSDGTPCRDAFASALAADGASLVFSTFLGGGKEDVGAAITIFDSDALVNGYTSSSDFPTTNDAIDRTLGASACGGLPTCSDAFMARIGPSGVRVSSTLLGGSGGDVGTAIAHDGSGNAFVAGYTESADFPTTAGAFRRTRTGRVDAFLSMVTFGTSSCAEPATARTVNLCSPQEGATFSSTTVPISATAKAGANPILRMEVWIDSKKRFEASNTNQVNIQMELTNGAHRVTVQAVDASGTFKATANITVTGGCSAPTTSRTIHICSPTNGATLASPVRVTGTAKPGSSAIKVMQVYVDGSKKFEKAGVTSIDTSLAMGAGAHRVTVQAIDSAGAFKATVNITVQ
jgi:hypothetical protein